MRLAKADLVPTAANLKACYGSFGELRAEAAVFCEQRNARAHRATGRPPVDRLA